MKISQRDSMVSLSTLNAHALSEYLYCISTSTNKCSVKISKWVYGSRVIQKNCFLSKVVILLPHDKCTKLSLLVSGDHSLPDCMHYKVNLVNSPLKLINAKSQNSRIHKLFLSKNLAFNYLNESMVRPKPSQDSKGTKLHSWNQL